MTPASPHDACTPQTNGLPDDSYISRLGATAFSNAGHGTDTNAQYFSFPKHQTLLKRRAFWMLTASKLVVIQVRTHETRPGHSASHPCARMVKTSPIYWEGQTTVSAARESN